MPAMPARLKDSPNAAQAIRAVVGGVRYSRLVTCVAALLRIRANSRKIAPIDKASTDHAQAPMNAHVHCTVDSDGDISSKKIASGSTTASEAANWTMVPVRKSKRGQ